VLYLGYEKDLMIKAAISSQGQVAIPKSVRDRLNLKAGTKLSIDVQGESLVMRRLVSGLPDWRTMEGMARGGESLTKALMEERAASDAGKTRPVRICPTAHWHSYPTLRDNDEAVTWPHELQCALPFGRPGRCRGCAR